MSGDMLDELGLAIVLAVALAFFLLPLGVVLL
jgi:hypothetical protein